MQRSSLFLLLPMLAGTVASQANAVPGLDGRLSLVDQFTYQGRRGAAHPNGEVAFSMLNTMCNPGTVQIPWFAAMQPNHPKFGFIAVRVANGRIEQISDRSYCKHAFTSTNSNGACGTCQSTGGLGGSVMGINCSDTYGVGNNNNRFWLGPPEELDPWLGTWNPVGSYFDQGDPNVGPPGNADGVRSGSYSGPDEVYHRVVVKESDLLTAGASYFYGIHLMHQGEPVANRDDNLASRGFTPSYAGGVWTSSNNAVGQAWGSILQRWPGATLNSGGNGNDDGRFFVAVLVSPLGGGQYHYEYAVHNVDNNRGGATFRVPVTTSAVTSNYTFGDIDDNSLNEWTGGRVGNEVVFTAPANNPLNWNTINNFGFDCNVPPGGGNVQLDEARLGAGALTVSVLSQVPGGVPVASVTAVGTGPGCGTCAGSFYEIFGSGVFDLSGASMTMTLTGNTYAVGAGTSPYVAPTGAALTMTDDSEVTVALPFSLPHPGGTTTQLRVCSNGFISPAGSNGTGFTPDVVGFLTGQPRWAAMWHDLNPATGGQVRVDSSASGVNVTWAAVNNFGQTTTATFQFQFRPNGTVHIVWQNVQVGSNGYLVGWTRGGGASDPGNRDLSTTLGAGFSLCSPEFTGLVFSASARPVTGTTVNLVTTNIPAGTGFGAVLLSFQQALPPLNLATSGMPGCFGHVVNGVTQLFFPVGSSNTRPLTIPGDNSLAGLPIIGQSFTYSPPLTPVGVIASNGLVMLVGQI